MENLETLMLIVAGLAVVVGLSTVSDRLGIAPPLILVVVGVGVSLLPFVASIRIDPQWILVGVLPPLLYSAAVAIPTVDLRRDFAAIGGLAVVLVVISALGIGFLVHFLIPDVPLALGIGLGAILSPTDAVATTMVRRLGVPSRVSTILQGESLLNDATALVLLRSTIAVTATSVSLWGVVGDFLWAALAAAAIGGVIGWAGVRLRKVIHDPAPATAISFLLPFVVYIACEYVHASGLVGAVAAGLATAHLGPKYLDARQRVTERANWHTVEFLVEGAVFLVMGLELYGLLTDLVRTHDTLWLAARLAGLAFVAMLVVRWIYVTVLVHGTAATASRQAARLQRWAQARANHVADPASRQRWTHRVGNLRHRLARWFADVDYLIRQPLGFKEASLLTWAGLRGVVTLAAAQTLPLGTPHRSLLIVIAFFVAAGSLVLQGGSLNGVARALGLAGKDAMPRGERARLKKELAGAAAQVVPAAGTASEDVALAKVKASRARLLDLRSVGAYSCESLNAALAELDAEEISLQVRRGADQTIWDRW